MNACELLEAMGEVREDYILTAVTSCEKKRTPTRPRRTLLLAAVIAALALLAGCAALFLRLQDLSIGREKVTQDMDAYGKFIDLTEVQQDILTFYGHSGSPTQQAARAWYEFTQGYASQAEDKDLPRNYAYTYGCTTQEMADQLNAIATQYGLKLLDAPLTVQPYQAETALEALGISSLFREGTEVRQLSGLIFPPENFWFDFQIQLEETGLWATPVSGRLTYSRRDCMPQSGYFTVTAADYDQWEYITASGTRVLLALGIQGNALMVADLEEAVMGVKFTISLNHLRGESDAAPSRAVVEALAEAVDLSIQPTAPDVPALTARLAALEESPQETPPVTYAGFRDYIRENCVRLRKASFAYQDLDGDGAPELLTGSSGFITGILSESGGTVQSWEQNEAIQLLAGGGLILGDSPESGFGFYDSLILRDGAVQAEGFRFRLQETEDGWLYSEHPQYWLEEHQSRLSPTEAQALLDANPPLSLGWSPVTQYPVEEGKTAGEYLKELDIRLPEAELKAKYAELAAEQIARLDYCRFRLLDINGDGVQDLLLSSDALADIDPDSALHYWAAYTYRYGTLLKLNISDFYLCRDGVLEYNSWSIAPEGGRRIHHRFLRLEDSQQVVLDSLLYFQAANRWETEDGQVISSEEAQAILDKYPRTDQAMQPISELTGNP